jgi:hypothetical protein
MGSAIASDSRASARTPNALTNVRNRTRSGCDRHSLNRKSALPARKISNAGDAQLLVLARAYSVRDRMQGCCLSFGGVLDRISATASSISESARPGGRRRSYRKPSPTFFIRMMNLKAESSCGWPSSYFFASCSLQDIIHSLAPDARQSLSR